MPDQLHLDLHTTEHGFTGSASAAHRMKPRFLVQAGFPSLKDLFKGQVRARLSESTAGTALA